METRHPTVARRDDSVLVVVDCQDRLWKVIDGADDVGRQIGVLARGARILGVPVVVTEQYPKGLGRTVAGVAEAVGNAPVLEKSTFSCAGDAVFAEHLRDHERGTVVVTGIEAHICVQQTALDLLADGYRVQIPTDGVGSRSPGNKATALRRMERADAVMTCAESVLFDWLERCDVPAFKEIQGLLK